MFIPSPSGEGRVRGAFLKLQAPHPIPIRFVIGIDLSPRRGEIVAEGLS